MRIKIIYGSSSTETAERVNQWLEANEESLTVLSVSPAMPRVNDGLYVTILYEQIRDVVFVPVDPSETIREKS